MKFIRDLLNRKPSDATATVKPLEEVTKKRKAQLPDLPSVTDTNANADLPKKAHLKIVNGDEPQAKAKDTAIDEKAEEILARTSAKLSDEADKAAEAAPMNIWDMEGEDAAEAAPEVAPTPRRRRNRTRLLGFVEPEAETANAFETAEKVTPSARVQFPVGWILVSDGPGRGECFTLEAGMSQIGRAEDQAIQLDFGDNSVSRVNHAAVVYDVETHSFMLGHGGKKNIVRLNGTPVISNEVLNTGDEIKIGETTLRFVALCSEDFNWADQETEAEEHDDVAIA